MNRVEKIKAEIGRLKKSLPWGSCASQISMECNCKNEAYNEVLSFIDSLSDTEKDFGIKEELKSKLKVKYANRIYDVVDCKKLPGEIIYYVIEDEIGHIDYINPDNCEVIEEPVSENTQFAQMADKYEQQVLIGEYQMKESIAHHCRLSYYLGLKDGAQWKKEKTMEDAVDAEVMTGTVIVERETMKTFLKYHGLKTGDKVKLIIIREE